MPQRHARQILTDLHNQFCLGAKPLSALLSLTIHHPDLYTVLSNITKLCPTCQRTCPQGVGRTSPYAFHQARGQMPGQNWQINFTHLPFIRKFKYLLVFIDTFTAWVEAFPIVSEGATWVTEALLQSIMPRFSLPTSIQSDNGPAFISQVIHRLPRTWE